MAAEERVRGLLCDLVYIGAWFALAPLYALGGGIEGLRWAALAEAVYLWASGLYRYYRPFNCKRWGELDRGIPSLALGLSALTFTTVLAVYSAVHYAASGDPLYERLLLASWASSKLIEVYALNYLPARNASRIIKGGIRLALLLTVAQLAVKAVTSWIVDAAIAGHRASKVGYSFGSLTGNVAAAYTLLWFVEKSR